MKRAKRRWVLAGRLAVCLAGAGAVFLTAPVMAEQLSGLTALSAGVSFGGWGVEQEQLQVEENPLDELPIHDGAGSLTAGGAASSTAEEEADAEPEDLPEKPEDAGQIIRETFGRAGGNVALEHGYVKNQTELSAAEVKELAQAELPFSLTDTEEPQVLIYHTHATESYMPYQLDWFDKSWKTRSTDNSENMTAVGDVLAEKLEAAGIGVIHDKEHYDASYTGAYDRSRVMIEEYLEKYPSIRVVLDVHRDAIGSDPVKAPVTTINGKSTAQVMIISCAGTDEKPIPDYRENLTFACRLQNQMETDYPTLTRPLMFCYRHYNQDLSPGALLIEVGSHGNTLAEAKNAISCVGDSLIHLLKGSG